MKRIEEIAKHIIPYKNIADVGCDHGYVIIEAFEKYNIKKAIAIDNKTGPLESAFKNLENKNYFKDIVFSLTNGIEAITCDTEVVIIAGMGGIMIVDILNFDLKNTKRIITQANKDNYLVRKKITSLGYEITNEVIIKEFDKYYEIIVFDKSYKVLNYNDFELEFGPILLFDRNSVFIEMLKEKLFRLKKISKKNNKIIENIKNIENIIKGVFKK